MATTPAAARWLHSTGQPTSILPQDLGQVGIVSPVRVVVTKPPARMRASVIAAVSAAKRRIPLCSCVPITLLVYLVRGGLAAGLGHRLPILVRVHAVLVRAAV